MLPKIKEEDRPTEDDIAREKLGPRGIPGEPSPAKMTPQRERKRRNRATSTDTPPDEISQPPGNASSVRKPPIGAVPSVSTPP